MNKPASLYYICHKDNLKSILQEGIFSRAGAKNFQSTSIHDEGVLAHRNKILIHNSKGKPLAEYVNLYFQPRNAMLYRLICNADSKNFAVLQINPSVLDRSGTAFSDRNAAVSTAKFYYSSDDLENIDGSVFKKEYWNGSDDIKQRMMAEVLVPDRIDANDIINIYLPKKNQEVSEIANKGSFNVTIQPEMFFLPTFRERISANVSLSKGDMFFSKLQTFTISVNLQGVMGKGLASRTRYQFPRAYVQYEDDCKSKKLRIGRPTLFKQGTRLEEELADDRSLLEQSRLNGVRWFLFLPTKRHWRQNSRFEDIEASMRWLLKNYGNLEIESIALPALGCGLGRLHWKDVGPMMCYYLNQMSITSCIYLPMEEDTTSKDYITPEYLLNTYRPK